MGQSIASKLTQKERHLLYLMAHGHCLTFEDVAELLGCDEEDVPTEMHRLGLLCGITFPLVPKGPVS